MDWIQKNRKIKKTYYAITEKQPKKNSDKLTNFLKKNQTKNKSFVVDETDFKSKKAVLNYKIIKKLDNYFLLEIILETGRHHQIRCQLSDIGCPIKGDVKYGAKRPNKDRSICLHSNKIEFIHPVTKKKLTITAQPPNSNIWLL